MIFIVVKWTIRPDRSHEWLELADEFTQATRNAEGNLSSSGPAALTTRTSSCWWRHSPQPSGPGARQLRALPDRDGVDARPGCL